MRLRAFFLIPALVAPVALAQTASKPAAAPVKHAAAPVAKIACSKLPDLSPKIPALPAGLPCAKPLYTITSMPPLRLDYISPMESPKLNELLGIVPTSFSLSYIDVKVGAGPLAGPDKWYTIHYTGYLVDGTKFDSSLDRGEPIIIPYGKHKVIPGWDTGFDGMHVGGKRRLFIPYQLAYGSTASGPIPPRSELIFDVELIAVSDTEPPPPAQSEAAKPNPPAQPAAPATQTPPPTPPPASANPAAH